MLHLRSTAARVVGIRRRHLALPLLLMLALACAERRRELAPIRLEPLTVVGATGGDGAMVTWPRISPRHPAGFRVLVPQPGGHASLPLVYDDSGIFRGNLTAGGSDESERFVEPLFARIGPGDSIWVFDGARRVMVFTPNLTWVRTVALPVAPWDAAILPDGRMAVTPAGFGTPLPWLVMSPDGRVIREVGDTAGNALVPSPRRIVAGSDGTIWTLAMTHRWQIEHWDSNGTQIARFTDAPGWFEPYDSLLATTAGRTPQGSVQDAWIDESGRVWVLAKAPDPDWREGFIDGPDGRQVSDANRAWDTVLLVYQGDTGELLSTARFDDSYPFVAEPGVLMRVLTTDEGWHRAELVEVVINESRLLQ